MVMGAYNTFSLNGAYAIDTTGKLLSPDGIIPILDEHPYNFPIITKDQNGVNILTCPKSLVEAAEERRRISSLTVQSVKQFVEPWGGKVNPDLEKSLAEQGITSQ
jgi:hypothetical protein